MGAVSVGVFGGAFDPPHVGHVELARRGIEQFDLDRLLVRVVEEPGHKDVSTAAARSASSSPSSRSRRSTRPRSRSTRFARTVDSLEALALDDPVFLVGADEFADFLAWKEPERVLELARLGGRDAAGSRPRAGSTPCSRGSSGPTGSRSSRSSRCPSPSSDIRARVAAGEPIDGLVPAAGRRGDRAARAVPAR